MLLSYHLKDFFFFLYVHFKYPRRKDYFPKSPYENKIHKKTSSYSFPSTLASQQWNQTFKKADKTKLFGCQEKMIISYIQNTIITVWFLTEFLYNLKSEKKKQNIWSCHDNCGSVSEQTGCWIVPTKNIDAFQSYFIYSIYIHYRLSNLQFLHSCFKVFAIQQLFWAITAGIHSSVSSSHRIDISSSTEFKL